MHRCFFYLALVVTLASSGVAHAQDEIFVRAKDKSIKGAIKVESPRGVDIGGSTIPTEDILDIHYEVNPVAVRLEAYRPAFIKEKDYLDPDPKKESARKANLGEAIKKYSEAAGKVKEKFARRHIEFKVAFLTARQIQEDGGPLTKAIEKLADFKAKHSDGWQVVPTLQLLARLQYDAKQYKDAEASYQELAAADVSADLKQEAELMAAQVGIRTGKHDASLAKLQDIVGKLPKDSKHRVKARVAQAECLAAAKKNPEAIAMLRQVINEITDKSLKAVAYNTLGQCYYDSAQYKEARWEFLWVDVVFNQDKAEHAKALYYLSETFDKLSEPERAQECREALIQDRAFAGMEWQRLAQKGKN